MKQDIQLLITSVETSCRQAVEVVREEVVALGQSGQNGDGQDDLRQVVADTHDMNSLLVQMDNLDN